VHNFYWSRGSDETNTCYAENYILHDDVCYNGFNSTCRNEGINCPDPKETIRVGQLVIAIESNNEISFYNLQNKKNESENISFLTKNSKLSETYFQVLVALEKKISRLHNILRNLGPILPTNRRLVTGCDQILQIAQCINLNYDCETMEFTEDEEDILVEGCRTFSSFIEEKRKKRTVKDAVVDLISDMGETVDKIITSSNLNEDNILVLKENLDSVRNVFMTFHKMVGDALQNDISDIKNLTKFIFRNEERKQLQKYSEFIEKQQEKVYLQMLITEIRIEQVSLNFNKKIDKTIRGLTSYSNFCRTNKKGLISCQEEKGHLSSESNNKLVFNSQAGQFQFERIFFPKCLFINKEKHIFSGNRKGFVYDEENGLYRNSNISVPLNCLEDRTSEILNCDPFYIPSASDQLPSNINKTIFYIVHNNHIILQTIGKEQQVTKKDGSFFILGISPKSVSEKDFPIKLGSLEVQLNEFVFSSDDAESMSKFLLHRFDEEYFDFQSNTVDYTKFSFKPMLLNFVELFKNSHVVRWISISTLLLALFLIACLIILCYCCCCKKNGYEAIQPIQVVPNNTDIEDKRKKKKPYKFNIKH